MTRHIDLRVTELLASRLCHDLIGPVSAIANGVELLADEDPSFIGDAVALVGESARKVNRRLQFFRFAYGFGGGGLTGLAPYQLVAEFFAETPIDCAYDDAVRELPLDRQKLACAMLAVAAEGLPRGGRIVLRPDLEIDASGDGPGPAPEIRAALSLTPPPSELNSRSVGAYFAGLLAEKLGRRLMIADRPGGFRLTAVAA